MRRIGEDLWFGFEGFGFGECFGIVARVKGVFWDFLWVFYFHEDYFRWRGLRD
jgi:hypothetical protein